MILAPLSELNGRYPVFVVAGTVFVVCQALCGVVRTLAGMLVVRFFVGAGASVFSSMVGGVIADMWDARERNMPMAVFSGAVLAGTGAGPLVGSVMAERLAEGNKWRWVFWHQAVAGGLLMAALAVMWRETRGSVVLSRKARALNRWYEALEGRGYYGVWVEEGMGGEGDEEKRMGTTQEGSKLRRIRWVVKEDEERASLATMIRISVTRPFHLLFTEPVVFFFSLWAAFAWGVLYLTFGSVPYVFQTVYGWPLSGSGYAFSAMVIGAVVATGMGIWQEKLLRHPKWASPAEDGTNSSEEIPSPLPKLPPSKLDPFWAYLRAHFPPSTPESRLYPTCLTSTLLPLGLFTFGFTAQPQLSPAGPLVGIFLSTLGIFSVYLAVFNYFADTYQGYASSALAAQSFCRNVLGGAFPLVTRRLYGDLGPVKAGAVLGGVAVVLTGVPWVLVLLGEGVRGRSGFAKKLVHT
ncbi:uncharacterized protein CTHT_0018160 [Thermochaetoides thermophila DSM 1495]|uniref:Major facilitator superfamily (MFS) profile domain-containing protein n=1 Tax=Chaetomium thermophilum (strain DSM 1495 / CBS 144.50 / IMI 039719) TaxID=759272 RepID=G0S2R2_CHATD|nr:hypothetical protein CTHT_0018160 [Thermochaetoides thermophila DSM 1495]EGS22295.1 hypothetical protein CTHT_0018160 [Thermochaetoides thermophila DSM 1495]